MTIFYNSFENLLTKEGRYYINLLETIIRHHKLHRTTCPEVRSSCTTCTSYRELLTPGIITSYFYCLQAVMIYGKKDIKRIFRGGKTSKNNIEPYQNVTGFYKKVLEALDKN